MSGLSRRALLALAGAALAGPARAQERAQEQEPRVATLDWALLETLLALGVVPVAAAELVLYRQVVVEPQVPAGVVDLGLRGAPNFEALLEARPSLIFNTPYYVAADPSLRRIAPVETLTIYGPGARTYERAEAAAVQLARAVGRPQAAERLLAQTQAAIASARAALVVRPARPLLIINLGDARHFRVFGADSMFGAVLARMGLESAWEGQTSYAASAPVGLETLARYASADIVILPPVPPDARRVLPESALWQALPNVRERRVYLLAPVNPFGALPTAARFARLLAEALSRGPGGGLG